MCKKYCKKISSIIFLGLILISISCKEKPTEPPDEKPLPLKESKWEDIGLQNEDIWRMEVDPTNSSIIYAASRSDYSGGTQGRIFKTANGGITWDTLLGGVSVACFTIDPVASQTVFAGTISSNYTRPGILKTTDGGNNWFWSDSGMVLNPERGVLSLAIDPKNRKTIYAGTGGFYGGPLYKSIDEGETWKSLGDSTNIGNIIDIEVSRMSSKIIFASTFGGPITKSTDGGETWLKVLTASSAGYLSVELWHKKEVFAFSNGDGLIKSTDLGETWEKISNTYSFPFIYDPSAEGYIYSGLVNRNEVTWSSDYGKNWQALPDSGKTWFVSGISSDGKYLFSINNGIWKYELR